VAGDIFAPTSRFGIKFRDAFVRTFNLFPAVKRYFVEMRFKPMPRYETGVVLLARSERKHGWLARVLERSGHSAPGRLLGLMSEKRESRLGRLVYGRDPHCHSPVGRMFIQPRVRTVNGEVMRLDDVLGNRFAILGWGSDPTFGLSPAAREIWQRLGGCFVIAKPDTQLSFHEDVPVDVIAIGDVNGRMKDWFSRVPESVVMVRPDRFVAGMCTPQQVSSHIVELAAKLNLNTALRQSVAANINEPIAARDSVAAAAAVAAVATGA
jgi:3-(3-hydroxy-phenyl)propionate hydroxylase